jgi:ribosomal protein S18 acetylase RimI-like enzyme
MLSKERNKIQDGPWELGKLEDFIIVKSFSCNDKDLDEYIQNDAEAHKKELLAETYILQDITIKNPFPVAFVSLCNDAIQLSKETKKHLLPNKKHYLTHPAVKIARLGVHKDFQNQTIGTYLLNMIKQLFLINNRTGCRFITCKS